MDASYISITKTVVLPFDDALYRGCCGTCGEELTWEADFDADGTTYSTRCCQQFYHMSTRTVEVTVEPEEMI